MIWFAYRADRNLRIYSPNVTHLSHQQSFLLVRCKTISAPEKSKTKFLYYTSNSMSRKQLDKGTRIRLYYYSLTQAAQGASKRKEDHAQVKVATE